MIKVDPRTKDESETGAVCLEYRDKDTDRGEISQTRPPQHGYTHHLCSGNASSSTDREASAHATAHGTLSVLYRKPVALSLPSFPTSLRMRWTDARRVHGAIIGYPAYRLVQCRVILC